MPWLGEEIANLQAGFSVRKTHFALIFFMSNMNNINTETRNKNMPLFPHSQLKIYLKNKD